MPHLYQQIKTNPRLREQSGVFSFHAMKRKLRSVNTEKILVGKYKRILLRLTMKNGPELKAPVTSEISVATAWLIKAGAFCLCLYGIAQLVSAVRWW